MIPDVCTLCLDFETFNLVGTNGSANDNEGDCIDTFTVTVALNNQNYLLNMA